MRKKRRGKGLEGEEDEIKGGKK
jgi:hypothetical protein